MINNLTTKKLPILIPGLFALSTIFVCFNPLVAIAVEGEEDYTTPFASGGSTFELLDTVVSAVTTLTAAVCFVAFVVLLIKQLASNSDDLKNSAYTVKRTYSILAVVFIIALLVNCGYSLGKNFFVVNSSVNDANNSSGRPLSEEIVIENSNDGSTLEFGDIKDNYSNFYRK